MTDKEYRDQKKRVEKLYDKWANPMGLRWFEVKHVWQRQSKEGAEGENAESSTAAEVSCDWRYRSAVITWYLPDLSDLSDKELERTVVHELVHILLDPLWHGAPRELRDEMELTTHTLAIAYLWVREAGQDDKPKPGGSVTRTPR